MRPTFAADFRPLPLLGNPHVQTVLGAYLPGAGCPRPKRQHLVRLPDGDALLLHENAPPTWKPGDPVALLLHGLTGDHASPHIRRKAARFLERGVRTFRMDMRGAGLGLPLARGSYHSGRTEDVRAALAEMAAIAPGSPQLLAGMSLGGNVALKLAGELSEHPVPGLARVAVIAPPIDLERCSVLLMLPRNRVYERRFVRALLRDARLRHGHFPDSALPAFPDRLTVRLFDDLYTAPRNGFRDALDYYRRASSFPLIARIPVPTLILTARDDPFIAVEPFEELRLPGHVELHILPRGGHVGFVGWDGAGGVHWGERRLVEWMVQERRATTNHTKAVEGNHESHEGRQEETGGQG
jgi:predicted alpha/beta-fold hydrolase